MSSDAGASKEELSSSIQTPTNGEEQSHAHAWLVGHADYLYRYALIRVRDVSAAEDLLQETLLAAMRSGKKANAGSNERAWLTGILRHLRETGNE